MEYYYDTYNQHLTWMNTKHILTTNYKFPSPINSFNRRFKERTSSATPQVQVPLGGFAWPPRSYTCSFCKREFRSAQALGGHMNVHRRDRARLNQSDPAPVRNRNIGSDHETKLSVRKSCLVDDTAGGLILNDCKRHKISDQRSYGNWCSSNMEEIDLELRLGSDPTAVK